MKGIPWLGFALLMLFDSLGQIGFKFAAEAAAPASLDFSWVQRVALEPWVYLAVSGYVGAFLTWMTILKSVAVGPAFAASHLEIVTVLIFSAVYLGERLTLLQGLGCLSILVGVGVLAVTEREH